MKLNTARFMAFVLALLGLAMSAVYSFLWARFPLGFKFQYLSEEGRFGVAHWLSILTPQALWFVGLGVGILLLKTRKQANANPWIRHVLFALPFFLMTLYVFFTKRPDVFLLGLGIAPWLPFLFFHHQKQEAW